VTADTRTRRLVLVGLLGAVIVAVVVSQFASSSPDGLEYVADQQGFAETAVEHPAAGSPLADYGAGVSDNGAVGRAVAGLIGVAATFGVGYGLLWMAGRRRRGTGT